MATPLQKNPLPEGHKIYNFGRHFLGYHYYTINLSEPCPNLEKIFLKQTSILHFLPANYVPLGCEVMNFTMGFSCLLTLQTLHTKFV